MCQHAKENEMQTPRGAFVRPGRRSPDGLQQQRQVGLRPPEAHHGVELQPDVLRRAVGHRVRRTSSARHCHDWFKPLRPGETTPFAALKSMETVKVTSQALL